MGVEGGFVSKILCRHGVRQHRTKLLSLFQLKFYKKNLPLFYGKQTDDLMIVLLFLSTFTCISYAFSPCEFCGDALFICSLVLFGTKRSSAISL